MNIRLKAKNENGIKGFEKLEKQSKGMLLKRMIKATWNKDDHSEITISPQNGVQMQKGKTAKKETLQRLQLYFSSVCGLSPNDYEVM